jgi:hypothetical protein
VAAELSTRGVSIIAAMTVLLVLQCGGACASDEAVDRATQKALTFDAHPDRGGPLFLPTACSTWKILDSRF